MKIISFAEANKDFRAVLDTVCASDKVLTIKRPKSDDTVIMSLKNYNSLMETLYLLGTPAIVAHLAKSIGQCQAGNTVPNKLLKN